MKKNEFQELLTIRWAVEESRAPTIVKTPTFQGREGGVGNTNFVGTV